MFQNIAKMLQIDIKKTAPVVMKAIEIFLFLALGYLIRDPTIQMRFARHQAFDELFKELVFFLIDSFLRIIKHD